MKRLQLSVDERLYNKLVFKSGEAGDLPQEFVIKVLEEHLAHVKADDDPPLFRFVGSLDQSQPHPRQGSFTFIDLFAGIGGMRRAFETQGGECIFTSEWDKFAQQTYEANFGERPHGDITSISSEQVPEHDILLAGFPCQPFSLAGISKKQSLGRATGFLDKAQGTLFFEVARIIRDKRPRGFLLENVKNLVSHDKGRTFTVIRETLEKLGYQVYWQVIDAQSYVPQHRERIFLVGFDRNYFQQDVDFSFPEPLSSDLWPKIGSILEKRVDKKFTLSDKLWAYLQAYRAKHAAAGNGFGFSLVGPTDTARTLSARYHKDGSEILVARKRGNPRKLTPRECARLMGFPEEQKIPVSNTQAYRQFGNAVVVPVVTDLAAAMLSAMNPLGGENSVPQELSDEATAAEILPRLDKKSSQRIRPTKRTVKKKTTVKRNSVKKSFGKRAARSSGKKSRQA